ncbi:MAG: TonB-dependent receptor, partial [Myxococcota bacterium]
MRPILLWSGTLSLVVLLSLLAGQSAVADEPEPGVGTPSAVAPESAIAAEAEPAQAAKPPPALEEIVVTGRKREELIQDTPLSIRAFSSVELEARTLERVDEIGRSTVNMLFDATDGSNQSSRIYIRGVGQDNSGRLVDPGVGTYVDGVYIPRSFGGLMSLIDLERIEVLRGPQGTLYGKNTVGGVVNLISTPPGMEFGGYGRIKWGNYATLETRSAVDIPINIGPFREKLYTRLSFATATDDGWTRNIVPGMSRKSGDNKLLGGRGSIRYLPTEDLQFDFHYDRTREHERQRVRHCIPGSPLNLARFIGDNLFQLGEKCAKSAPLPKHDGFAFPTAKNSLDTEGANFHITWDISETMQLKSISSWRERKSRTTPSETSGGDPSVTPFSTLDPLDVFSLTQMVVIPNGGSKIRHDAWSQELQLLGSALDGRLRYVGGLYWFKEKGHTKSNAALPRFYSPGSPLDLAPPGCCAYANPGQPLDDFTAVALDMQRQLLTADTFFLILGPLFQALGGDPSGLFAIPAGITGPFVGIVESLSFTTFNKFDNYSYAAFGNVEYDITDKLTIEAGLRRTQERKSSQAREVNFFTGREDFGDNQNKRFDNWSPMAKLRYRFTDDIMGYLGFSKGWKSGGFNSTRAIVPGAISAQQTPEEAKLSEFDPETADTWELGLRSTWLDNRLVVNVTGFYNTYRDIQLSISNADERGLATTQIRNAAKAKVWGAELEVTALPMDGLTLTMGLGHTNADYEDFTAAKPDPITVFCSNLVNSGIYGQRRPGVDPIPLDEGFLDLSAFGFQFPVPIGFASLLTGGFVPDDPRVVSLLSTLFSAPAGECAGILLAPTFGILSSRTFKNVSFDDKHFKFTPAWTFNASASYVFDVADIGSVAVRADWYSRSKTYFDVINSPELTQEKYG